MTRTRFIFLITSPEYQRSIMISLSSALRFIRYLIVFLMGNRLKRLSLPVLFLPCILLIPGYMAAKDWSIPLVEIEAEIRPDGTILYTEHRTYKFEGSFSEADYILPKQGFTELTGLRIYDNGSPMLNQNTKEPGTFRVQENNRNIHITLYYQARDEERTFTVQYILHDAVMTGPEHAEFNWTYLSNRWDRPTEDLRVSLRLPGDPDASEIHTWIRGSEDRTNVRSQRGMMTADAQSVPKSGRVEIRTVFPAAGLRVPVNDPGLSLSGIQKEEAIWREEQVLREEREARNELIGIIVSVVLLIIGLIALIVLYNKYGRRHQLPQRIPEELYEIPVDEPPALAGWLYYQSYIGGAQLMATLLDLARRGYFRIEQFKTEKTFLKPETDDFYVIPTDQEPEGDLTEWEEHLFNFLREETAVGKKSLTEIFEPGSQKASALSQEWNSKVKSDAETRGWFEPASKTGMYKNLLLQLALAVIALTGMVFISMSFTILLMGAVVLAVLSALIQRKSEHGEFAYRSLIAYRNALSKGKPSEFITPKDKTIHLLYAISLGVTGKQFERLTENLDMTHVTWLYFYGGVFNPVQLASAMNTLVATGTTTAGSVAGGMGAVTGVAGGGAGGGAR